MNRFMVAIFFIMAGILGILLVGSFFSIQFAEDFCEENYELYKVQSKQLAITGECLLIDESFVINDKYKIKCNRLNRKCEII